MVGFHDKLNATILKSIGEIKVSDTETYKVLIVRDEKNNIRVSVQVWWEDEYGLLNPGKGYFLTGRTAIELSKGIHSALVTDSVETISLSNTQKLVISKKEGNMHISKWWRKDRDSDWNLNKDVFIHESKAPQLAELVEKAGLTIIFVK